MEKIDKEKAEALVSVMLSRKETRTTDNLMSLARKDDIIRLYEEIE